jgi:dTDP-glucose 4,6-dehydratase
MRILVTGGLGFIGSHFVRRAMASGICSSVLVLDAETYASDRARLQDVAEDYELLVGSIENREIVVDALLKVDVVVNFAAETHNDNSLVDSRKFYETNVLGLEVLASECARRDIYLHHVSTDEVFGDLDFDSTDKFSLHSSYNPSSPYSASKAAGDLLVKAWARSFGLRYTISNCSNNFGAGQHSEKFLPTAIRSLSNGSPVPIYGTGKNIRDWIRVEDHVDGILSIISGAWNSATFLFGASDEVTNLDIALALGGKFKDVHDPVEYIADRAGHDRRYAIDWSETKALLGWEPQFPKILDSLEELKGWYTQ